MRSSNTWSLAAASLAAACLACVMAGPPAAAAPQRQDGCATAGAAAVEPAGGADADLPPIMLADPDDIARAIPRPSGAMLAGREPPFKRSGSDGDWLIYGVGEPPGGGAGPFVHEGDITLTGRRIVLLGDVRVTGSVSLIASDRVVLLGSIHAGDGTAERPDGGGVLIVAPELWVFGEERVLGGHGFTATPKAADAAARAAAPPPGKRWPGGIGASLRGGDGGGVLLFSSYRADGVLQIAGGHGGHGAHAPADPRGAADRAAPGTEPAHIAGGRGGHGGHAVASGLNDLALVLMGGPIDRCLPMPAGRVLPHIERHHPGSRGSPGIVALAGEGGHGGQGSDAATLTRADGRWLPAVPAGPGGRGGDVGAAIAGSGTPGADGAPVWSVADGWTYGPRGPGGGTGGPGGLAHGGRGGDGGHGGRRPLDTMGGGGPPGPGGAARGVRGGAGGQPGLWGGAGGAGGSVMGSVPGQRGNNGRHSQRDPRQDRVALLDWSLAQLRRHAAGL